MDSDPDVSGRGDKPGVSEMRSSVPATVRKVLPTKSWNNVMDALENTRTPSPIPRHPTSSATKPHDRDEAAGDSVLQQV
jgi:hypothetical protein